MELKREDMERILNSTAGECAIYRMEDGLETVMYSDGIPVSSGYTREEYDALTAGNPTAVILERDRAYVEKTLAAYLSGSGKNECSYRTVRKDGSVIWIHAKVNRIGEENGFPLILAGFTNISLESEAYAELLDQINVIVYISAADTHELLYANQAALDFWKKGNTYAGKCCYDFIRGRKDPCPWCSIPKVENGSFHADEVYDPEMNRYFQIDCKCAKSFGRDAYTVFSQDITDSVREKKDTREQYRKTLKEQLDLTREALNTAENANRAKSLFLTNISHDMRTPLNGILGYTGLALKTGNPGEITDYLNKIKASGSMLLDLVNDALQLSLIENGKLSLNYEPVNSLALLNHILIPIAELAREKQVSFIINKEKVPDITIRADRLNTQKIFLNLLNNAIKFTPGGGTVTFTVEPLEEPERGNNCKFIVEDTGIGIGSDFLPILYEPFTQEHGNGSLGEGTGLGLSIVHQLLNLMGGRIEVSSTRGKGTRFTVYMNFNRTDEKISGNQDEAEERRKNGLYGKKVLLCEDNYMNAEIARKLLEQRGLEVQIVQNGRDGFHAFLNSGEEEFSAILMDLRMPVMNGYEATEAIRNSNRRDARDIPIIAMTADTYEADVRRCLSVGMNGHVAKPVDPDKLFRELERFIGI